MRIIESLLVIAHLCICSVFCCIGFAGEKDPSTFADPTLSGLAKDTIAVYIYGDDLFLLTKSLKIGEQTSEHDQMLDHIHKTTVQRIAYAGINVTNMKIPWKKVYPRFYVGISLSDAVSYQTSYGYAFTVIVGLSQQVTLSRNRHIRTNPLTWQRWSVGFASKDNAFYDIMKTIEEKTDEFIIEFLKSNRMY